jgi:phosphatidylserine/phosphatidylglycerophosphate/cardiolipin synthase-like enzyme
MTARGRDLDFASHRRSATIRSGLLTLSIFALALGSVRVRPALAAQIEVCFSPPLPGGCDPNAALVSAIASARRSILVQAYEITPGPLVTALIEAHRRGVDVRAIVDYKQFTDRRNHDDAFAVQQLSAAGIPVLLDRPPGLMHNKVMIIDDQVVVTGSFNYTYSAEHRNVENLLVIRDPALAAQYVQHWKSRAVESHPLFASAKSRQSLSALDGAGPASEPNGPVIGNRRSRVYEWPGCPAYDKISTGNRVQFANAQAAEQAGYRAARNCR